MGLELSFRSSISITTFLLLIFILGGFEKSSYHCLKWVEVRHTCYRLCQQNLYHTGTPGS